MFAIRPDDLSGVETRALIALHLSGMRASSPPEHVSALDLSGLRTPDVRLWSAWDGESLAAIGALKQLSPTHGEIKSMRTHPDFLRRGAAAAILDHILAVARLEGMRTLSLETGSGPDFEPALALYRKRGFRNGDAFGDYPESAFNQFLHRTL